MPLDTMASAISRTVLSSILSANLFQLFQPIGGVRARSAARHADAESTAKRTSRFMSAIECIACEPVQVGGGPPSHVDPIAAGEYYISDEMSSRLAIIGHPAMVL